MATKPWSAAFLDPALNFLKNNSNRLVLCSQEPTTYTEAVDTFRLAQVNITSADFSGPDNGAVNGRRLHLGEKAGVTVNSTGIAVFFALVNTSALALRYVGPGDYTNLVAGSEITMGPVIIELRDPY